MAKAQAQVIIHPAFAMAQKRRKQQAFKARNQKKTEVPPFSRMRTRELKYLIEMLALVLTLPESHPMAFKDKKSYDATARRLDMYLTELEARDKRDDQRAQQPLKTEQLSQRFQQDLSTKYRVRAA